MKEVEDMRIQLSSIRLKIKDIYDNVIMLLF